MKHALAAALLLASTSAFAADVTPDRNDGFCAGWKYAMQIERTRFETWRALVVGNVTPSSAFGIALSSIADSIPSMVMLPDVRGKLTLDDGSAIDCTPKPPVSKNPPAKSDEKIDTPDAPQ